MIVAMLRLIREHKLQIVTTHDLINWAEGSVQLCTPMSRGLDDSLKIAVWTGCPTDLLVPRKSKLMDDVKKIMRERPPVKPQLNEGDIIDRFISKGKLWLVTRDFKTIDESTVRLTKYRCVGCRVAAKDERETRLFHRQNDFCQNCFEKLLDEEDRFEYARSTWCASLHHCGYRIEYDPVMGRVRKIQIQSDTVNRMRHEAGIYGVRTAEPVTPIEPSNKIEIPSGEDIRILKNPSKVDAFGNSKLVVEPNNGETIRMEENHSEQEANQDSGQSLRSPKGMEGSILPPNSQ